MNIAQIRNRRVRRIVMVLTAPVVIPFELLYGIYERSKYVRYGWAHCWAYEYPKADFVGHPDGTVVAQ